MECNGIVRYKGIEARSGGTFKNDRGQNIDYGASYVIKFDEEKDGNINERKLKFPSANSVLADKFKQIPSYTKVKLTCDVVISNTICKLVPTNVEVIK